MPMESSAGRFSLFKFVVIVVIASIIPFVLASIVCSFLLSLSQPNNSDYFWTLPLQREVFPIAKDFFVAYFGYLGKYFYLTLYISAVVLIVSFVTFAYLVRNQNTKDVKGALLFLIIFLIPEIYLISKAISDINVVFLYYVIDFRIFEMLKMIYLVVALPSWFVFCSTYVLFSNANKLFKYVFCGVICLSVLFLNYYFLNIIDTKAENYNYKKDISSVKGLNLEKEVVPKTFGIIYPDGKVKQLTISPEFKNVPVNRRNWKVLKSFASREPLTFLIEDINNFALTYSLYNADFSELKEYLLDNYLKTSNFYNSSVLLNIVKSGSNLNDIPKRLEKAYEDKNNIVSKRAYGTLAVSFYKIDSKRKANKYWLKYDQAPEERYIGRKVQEWTKKFKLGEISPTIFRGKLAYDDNPLKNTTVFLFNKKDSGALINYFHNKKWNLFDTVLGGIYDSDETTRKGSFVLISWSCDPMALLIDVQPDSIKGPIGKIDNFEDFKCGQENDLGMINLNPNYQTP